MLPRWPLLAIIVLSGTGAVLVALLALRNLRAVPADDSDADEGRAWLLPRLGYAMVAACFTAVTLLAVVAAVHQARAGRVAAPAEPPSVDARLEGRVDDLEARLTALDDRLASISERAGGGESRMAAAEARFAAAGDRVANLESRITSLENHVAATRLRAPSPSAPSAPRMGAPSPGKQGTLPAGEPPRAVTASPSEGPAPSRPSVEEAQRPGGPPAAEVSTGARPSRPHDGTWPTDRPRDLEPPVTVRTRPAPDLATSRADSPRPASPSPSVERTASTPARPARSFDLGDRLREDWEAIKRDTRAGGRELQEVWEKVRGLFD